MSDLDTDLDLDGVLVDLAGGVLELYGLDPGLASLVTGWDGLSRVITEHSPQRWVVTEESMWATVDAAGPGFWAGLRPYPWAGELYSLCAAHGRVTILTTCAGPGSAAGKAQWVADHLPKRTSFALVGVSHSPVGVGCKHHFGRSGAILVDDSPDNCQLYSQEGGWVFQWPAPWNGGVVSPHTHESAGWAAVERLRSALESYGA